MYEKVHQPLASSNQFYCRLLRSIMWGLLLIASGVMVGMLGYHYYEGMSWVDAFANAAMILSGMGPFGPLQTTGGKIFSGMYALFSGLVFIAVMGVIFAPVVHRFFHSMHLDQK